jgi:hypothetical protein
MNFKEMVETANKNVFLATDKFAEERTVKYNGEAYVDIPIILAKLKEDDRKVIAGQDGGQGLFRVSAVLRCAKSDLGEKEPEQGQRISVNHRKGGGGYFSDYTVATSSCVMGMLRLELEAIDE